MQLRVGELARRSGLTVRALHHYDDIGLLQPSGRTDSGYRLYSQADVQRLHGIQALRHLGLSLQDIASLLANEGPAPGHIIAQQMRALDQQIEQANELRGRLALLRDGLIAGAEPDMGNWLETLALMATYGKYFSAAELQRIFKDWKSIEVEWLPLMAKVRGAMQRGLAAEAPEVQMLAHRWMSLMLHWMNGDTDLLERWGGMYRQEPSAQGLRHAPPGDMIEFMEIAIKLRLAALARHLQPHDLRGLGYVPLAQWDALESCVADLLCARVAPGSPQGQTAAAQWNHLMDQLTRHDPVLRAKLQVASENEALLRAGAPLSPAVRAYIAESLEK